eukprot:1157375-Pelagomonas_calceolata.AAC.18
MAPAPYPCRWTWRCPTALALGATTVASSSGAIYRCLYSPKAPSSSAFMLHGPIFKRPEGAQHLSPLQLP